MLFRGQNLGKYKIMAPLGSGGFGAVYLARDIWLDKDVAVKVPHRQNLNFDELLREPRLLAALDHPNIVSITTAEKQDNVFFIVMEYVAGQTLEEIITSNGGLDPARAVHYAAQIGQAMAHAHGQGVIHRDLRPANMLVTDADVLKVADFGTSRFLEIAAHGTTVIGSPPYMAPEQFEGKAVFASDIYSLGVTLYQMLTAVLPYESPAPADLDRLRSGELVRPPRFANPAVPRSLDDVVMKALAPALSARYQRVTELLGDLEQASAPAPPPAPDRLDQPPSEPLQARVHVTPRRPRTATPSSGRFCPRCHKPLHARAASCPFCGEGR